MQAATNILIMLLLLASAHSAGRMLLMFFRISPKGHEQSIMAAGIGLGAISFILYLLGFLKLYYTPLLAALLAVLSLPAIVDGPGIIKKTAVKCKELLHQRNLCAISIGKILWAAIILVFVGHFFLSFAPVFDFDSLNYHITVPKNYLRHHSIYELPPVSQNFYGSQGVEMLYIYDAAFSDGTLAQMITYALMVMTTLLIYSLASRHLGKNTGTMAAFIFATIPIISQFSVTPKNDIATAFYSLLLIAALMMFLEKKTGTNLALIATLGGFAYLVKPTTLGIVAAVSLITAFTLVKGKKLTKEMIKGILLAAGIFILIASPQLLRNMHIIGNPVFPIFHTIQTQYWTGAQVEHLEWLIGTQGDRSIPGILKFPITVVADPYKYGELLGISPLFIGVLPLLFLIKRRRLTNILAMTSAIYLVGWFAADQTIRYLFPVFPLMSIVSSDVLVQSGRKNIGRMLTILIPVAILVMFNFALMAGTHMNKAGYLLGMQDKEQFYSSLKDKNPYLPEKFINENYPEGKILLYNMVRGAYLDVDFYYGDPYAQSYIKYSAYNTSEQLAARLKELGVCCVLMRTNYFFREGDSGWEHPDSLMKAILENATRTYDKNGFLVYELRQGRT